MTDYDRIHVSWDRGERLPQVVQYKCDVCRHWITVGEIPPGGGGGGVSIPLSRCHPRGHPCRWWTRLGPVTEVLLKIRKRKIQYRSKNRT